MSNPLPATLGEKEVDRVVKGHSFMDNYIESKLHSIHFIAFSIHKHQIGKPVFCLQGKDMGEKEGSAAKAFKSIDLLSIFIDKDQVAFISIGTRKKELPFFRYDQV